jgi:hypothetical protein
MAGLGLDHAPAVHLVGDAPLRSVSKSLRVRLPYQTVVVGPAYTVLGDSLITRSGRPDRETIAAPIKALRYPQRWQLVMAVETDLPLDMFDGRLC